MSERILCAAIWYKDEPTPAHSVKDLQGLVLCGRRHHDIIAQYSVLRGRTSGTNHEQGFLTSTNRYVNRTEAAQIAVAAGQVLEADLKVKDKLFSEDLY